MILLRRNQGKKICVLVKQKKICNLNYFVQQKLLVHLVTSQARDRRNSKTVFKKK